MDRDDWDRIEPDLGNYIVEACGRWADYVLVPDLLDNIRGVADAFYHPSKGSLLDFCKRTAERLIERDYGAWILERDMPIPNSQERTLEQEPRAESAEHSRPTWFPKNKETIEDWRKIADGLEELEMEFSDRGEKPPKMADRRTRMQYEVGYTRSDSTIYRILKARREGWI